MWERRRGSLRADHGKPKGRSGACCGLGKRGPLRLCAVKSRVSFGQSEIAGPVTFVATYVPQNECAYAVVCERAWRTPISPSASTSTTERVARISTEIPIGFRGFTCICYNHTT